VHSRIQDIVTRQCDGMLSGVGGHGFIIHVRQEFEVIAFVLYPRRPRWESSENIIACLHDRCSIGFNPRLTCFNCFLCFMWNKNIL
jgi:hypothetical protein